LGGVSITRQKDVMNFLKLATPITNVVVSKGRLYNGLSKKSIAMAVMDMLDSDVPLSKYFKNKKEALLYKNFLNSLLYRKIREYHSPLV
jgi:hypothetical protein